MKDSIYHMTTKLLKSHFGVKKIKILPLLRNIKMDVLT